ncbi:solid-state culture specific protein [Penicillium canescens]|uniref:Solid-state culture specific protein n=1 Tax=Penicillium canescens TaxID=5083 RepID=A0AAD6N7T2_PENCN|nr:solid-state culture specific protein [Penicillium canescens]KAJ6038674.1 solid-state culture specific protein [Penicillium canescens]KAJ6059956.1 solid-state culture specific protein [Penicillium canescens]
MLARINQESYSHNPCSLVLQRYIAWKVVAILLFVTTQARPGFIACCKQTMSTKGDWIGASISYRDQADLKQEYVGIIDKAAGLLHQEGYHGPAGIDVITDRLGD